MSEGNFGPGRFTPYFTFGAPSFRTREEQLKHDLDVALERLRALQELPGVYAAILEVKEKYVTITTGPTLISVKRPRAMEGLEVGAVARLAPPSSEGQQPTIISIEQEPPASGPIVTVKQLIDEHTAEVQLGGQSKIVFFRQALELEAGDRVVLDITEHVISRNLGKTDKTHAFSQETGVTWSDIGGQDKAVAELIEAIEEPVRNAELYARYGQRPVRGILLYGPPGNGKTLLAKAAATSLGKTYGANVGGFIYVKGPEILNMFVGNSEQAIRQLFSAARSHKETHNYPALMFIDEGDAIMGKRGLGFREGMERTIVPQFLSEMDGLEDAGCMILVATNRPDTLDPAITREGRIDTKILVRRPDVDGAKKIFSIYMKKFPLAKGVSYEGLVEKAAETLFDDKHALFMIRCKDGKNDCRFALREVVSGALIESIVQKATKKALRRERDGKTPKGVVEQDLVDTIKDVVIQNKDVNHQDVIRDFIEEKKLDVKTIERV